MDRFERLNGVAKAALTVAFVLVLTGTLVLLAAEKTAAEKDDHGFLGVSVRSLEKEELDELGVKHGLRVAAVEKESAAAKAGIFKNDVIQSLNNEKIRDPQSLSEIVRELPPGNAVKIGLWRGGKALEVKAILGKYERPKRFHWSVKPLGKLLRSRPYLGVNIMDLDEGDLAFYFAVKTGEGVLITSVEKETPAAKAGLKPGDVIVQVGGKVVKESGDIHEALAELKKGDSVDVMVVRRGQRETVKAVPAFRRQPRVLRFFGGDKDMAIEHLEIPELDIEVPHMDMAVPEPPDAPEIERLVREKLDHVREQLDHAHEKMDAAKIKIEKKLRQVGENYWI